MTAARRWETRFVVVGIAAILIAIRLLSPERSPSYIGTRALLDLMFAIGLTLLILLVALGVGLRLQRLLRIDILQPAEAHLFSIPLGLGVIAVGVFLLGLGGALQPTAILTWMLISAAWSHSEWTRFASRLPKWIQAGFRSWKSLELMKKLILSAMAIILAFALAQALSPPTDPDGLIDHLAVPKLFLEIGRLQPMPDFIFANYPLTLESLFAIGMAFGSDTVAKLLHLSFGVLLVLATFMLGYRYLAAGAGWFAAAILVGMPIYPVWAGLAYVDMGWALYAFCAVYALAIWADENDEKSNQLLVLAGVMTGFALGTKYLALGGAAAAGLWILWHSRKGGWRAILVSGAVFGGAALLVGAPWYLRNLFAFGNPVYPYFGPASGNLVANYDGFGIVDYLLLPISLYTKRELFVGVYGSIEFPSIFFLLAIMYPLTARSVARDALAGMTLLRYLIWAVASHWRFRYLLPAMPGLALLAAHVTANFLNRHSNRRWPRIAVGGLIGGMLAVTVVYSALFFAAVRPWRVILGIESKAEFLRREVSDYAAKEFIQANLPPDAKVLMPWNARSYYCDRRCAPDWLRLRWVELVTPRASPQEVAGELRALKVTHLLISAEDVDYSVINDPSGASLAALEFLVEEFQPVCTREIYRDQWTNLLELEC